MKKLFKKHSLGESIEAYAVRAYCTCTCSDCGCTYCIDEAHNETVFQVTINNRNSNDNGMLNHYNGY